MDRTSLKSRSDFLPSGLRFCLSVRFSRAGSCKAAHMSPSDAMRAHEDLGAKTSIGIHFGTFRLADDAEDEPVNELQRILDSAAGPQARFLYSRRRRRPGHHLEFRLIPCWVHVRCRDQFSELRLESLHRRRSPSKWRVSLSGRVFGSTRCSSRRAFESAPRPAAAAVLEMGSDLPSSFITRDENVPAAGAKLLLARAKAGMRLRDGEWRKA